MSDPPTRICVFCSTTSGHSPAHMEAARSLAHVLHANKIHLVYGGGTTGLMGELAKILVALSGPDSVHGIIPGTYLSIERPEGAADPAEDIGQDAKSWPGRLAAMFTNKRKPEEKIPATKSALLSEEIYGRTTVVADVQIRKKLMAREIATGGLGSGFIGLSGGFGTMDELVEMVTWNQLRMHDRGVCVLNVEGFWDPLMVWMERAIEAGFVREGGRRVFVERGTGEECVRWLREFGDG